jgi:hypothetical protein
LKESGAAYTDFAENGLPRLKAKYAKKFADVEVCAPVLLPLA